MGARAVRLLALCGGLQAWAWADQCAPGGILVKDKDNGGTVLSSKKLVKHPADCCDLCTKAPTCVYWVYKDGGDMEPTCKLLSNKGADEMADPGEGTVSAGACTHFLPAAIVALDVKFILTLTPACMFD